MRIKKAYLLLVIVGLVILLIGFCVYDKGPTKIYRVYEWSQEKK